MRESLVSLLGRPLLAVHTSRVRVRVAQALLSATDWRGRSAERSFEADCVTPPEPPCSRRPTRIWIGRGSLTALERLPACSPLPWRGAAPPTKRPRDGAGVGIEAAARRFGLGFVSQVEEDCGLICLRDAPDQPAVIKLLQALCSSLWRVTVAAPPGYTPARSGDVLSLTQALPWRHFREPMAAMRG